MSSEDDGESGHYRLWPYLVTSPGRRLVISVRVIGCGLAASIRARRWVMVLPGLPRWAEDQTESAFQYCSNHPPMARPGCACGLADRWACFLDPAFYGQVPPLPGHVSDGDDAENGPCDCGSLQRASWRDHGCGRVGSRNGSASQTGIASSPVAERG